jgi:hypothetical protein
VNSDEPGPEALAVCGINRCNNSCPIDQVVRVRAVVESNYTNTVDLGAVRKVVDGNPEDKWDK